MQTASFFTFRGAGRISIARSIPKSISGVASYAALAPGGWFRTTDITEYRRLYFAQLAKLDPKKVVDDLTRLAGSAEPVLLCWETLRKPGEWCHRRMVAEWLWDTLKLHVPEMSSPQGRDFDVAGMFPDAVVAKVKEQGELF